MEDKEQKGWSPFFAARHFYDKHNSTNTIVGQKTVIFSLKNVLLCVKWNRDCAINARKELIAREKMRSVQIDFPWHCV